MMRLQRITKNNRDSVEDCINTYANFVWGMAGNLTDSLEDRENVIQEIFLNIWRYAEHFESTDFDELIFITIMARRRLIEKSKEN